MASLASLKVRWVAKPVELVMSNIDLRNASRSLCEMRMKSLGRIQDSREGGSRYRAPKMVLCK